MVNAAAKGPSGRTLTLISAIALLCLWQLLSLVAGSNQANEHNVPNLVDIADSLKSSVTTGRADSGWSRPKRAAS